jgi:TolB-like protein/lipopolysaccharide biosynthesis regulator YciM
MACLDERHNGLVRKISDIGPAFLMSFIRFGEFELDEQTFELRRKGVPTRIQRQPARVLAFLLNHPGTVVTRDQIRNVIWGEDTFVDFEQGLNFCIRQIRITLNDQAEKPRFIETLPRLGYRFIAPLEKIEAKETTAAKEIPADRRRIRIAVVPIEPLGGAAEDYFAAGLTYDMISALSRIDPVRLRVTAGPRLLSGEPVGEQLKRLQRELDLDYLLRGSVRRSAETIRISAQLHDLRDKSVLWSETYDRNSSDLLAVQEEVTMRVSQSLALELLPGSAMGSRKYARSAASYDAYLKGRFFWYKMTRDTMRSSIACFTEAITIDPGFAPAYAGLADCYAQMGSIRVGIMKPLDALAKATPLLQRAMELDNNLAEAHCTLGLLKSWYDLDWAGAEQEFQVALSLDSSHLTTLLWQSLYLSAMGRHEESIASVKRARESEPLSPIMNMYLGVAQMHAGQYDLAIRQLKQAIELDLHSYRPLMFLGRAYSDLDRHEDSVAAFRQALTINPENLESLAYMGQAMADLGNRRGALNVITKVKAAESRTEPAILLACIYASLGEDSEMFRALDRALKNKSVPLYVFLLSKTFRRYESDARYHEFLRSMGVPQLVKA